MLYYNKRYYSRVLKYVIYRLPFLDLDRNAPKNEEGFAKEISG